MTMNPPALASPHVSDVMHTGILMTDPDTPLRQVARLMADRRVHVVALAENGQMRRPLRVITALDVATAVAGGEDLTAGQAARTELPAVGADQPLQEAARLMARGRIEHLVVVDPDSAHAEGIISTLDIAAALGR